MNKKIKFGIISGAGPMAGSLLYRRIIEKLQAKGAWHDADFPEILILNVPFSEMLSGKTDTNRVQRELFDALDFVSQSVDHIYIACQTLHSFLTQNEIKQYKVVSLLALIKQAIINEKNVLVVASKTSRLFNLHSKHLQVKCDYIEPERSDNAIEDILKGKSPDLKWLENLTRENLVVLGCTEFSVALKKSTAKFIDPIELAAEDIVDKFIQNNCKDVDIAM